MNDIVRYDPKLAEIASNEIVMLSEKESTVRNFVFEEKPIKCCMCAEIIGYHQLTDEKEMRFENQEEIMLSGTSSLNVICSKCRMKWT